MYRSIACLIANSYYKKPKQPSDFATLPEDKKDVIVDKRKPDEKHMNEWIEKLKKNGVI